MASIPRGLAIIGLAIALTGTAQSAAAAAPGTIVVADDDVPTDTPTDMMPADSPTDVPTDMLSTDIPTATPTPSPTATPTPSPTITPTATPTINPVVIIQQVIQRSNDEQVQAVATRNMSLVADTLTDAHVPELVSILQDMIDHKVSNIALLKLDWGPIVVAADGTGAVANTTETWRIVSEAGTVDYEPAHNVYALVFDNATWKIKSDVQVAAPAQTP